EFRWVDQRKLRVLPQGCAFRKSSRQLRSFLADETRAWRKDAVGGPDGADGAQRGRGRRLRALLVASPGCRSGSHQRRRDQPDAAGRGSRLERMEISLPLPVARADVRETIGRCVSLLPEL